VAKNLTSLDESAGGAAEESFDALKKVNKVAKQAGQMKKAAKGVNSLLE